MIWVIIGCFIVMLLVFVIFVRGKDINAAYISKKPLTQPEQILYFRLKQALPNYEILAQVPFSRFIYTKGGTKRQNWGSFIKIKQKIIDYLICTKDFTIVAAIELDDKSHNKRKDQIRDSVLTKAGITIIRWNVKELPTKEHILNSLEGVVTNETHN